MARKIQVQVKIEMLHQAEDEFAYAYGRTMAAWSDIERSLYHWFWYITGLKDGMARGIYFGTRGFGIRLDMLEAAIEHADKRISAEEAALITAAVNKARSFSSFRNAIAHGEPRATVKHTRLKEGDIVDSQEPEFEADGIHFEMIQAKDVTADGISIEDMANAFEHFHTLANAITSAVPHHRKGRPLAELLEQVTALPNRPDSKNDQNPSAPGQSPQSGGRVNKKAHRAAQEAEKAKRGG